MARPYANVVISDPDTLDTKAFFVVQRDGTTREVIEHNIVTESSFLERVSFAAYLGMRVDYYVCDAEYIERQRATLVRKRN
jgi:hypothetical protein